MSAKYSLNEFMWDFIALWKNPELEKLNQTPEARGYSMRAYFLQQYGENAQAFGDLHMKAVSVLGSYLENHRPELAKAVERTPHSLAVAVFYWVNERGVDSPTAAMIEAVEANQNPKN